MKSSFQIKRGLKKTTEGGQMCINSLTLSTFLVKLKIREFDRRSKPHYNKLLTSFSFFKDVPILFFFTFPLCLLSFLSCFCQYTCLKILISWIFVCTRYLYYFIIKKKIDSFPIDNIVNISTEVLENIKKNIIYSPPFFQW